MKTSNSSLVDLFRRRETAKAENRGELPLPPPIIGMFLDRAARTVTFAVPDSTSSVGTLRVVTQPLAAAMPASTLEADNFDLRETADNFGDLESDDYQVEVVAGASTASSTDGFAADSTDNSDTSERALSDEVAEAFRAFIGEAADHRVRVCAADSMFQTRTRCLPLKAEAVSLSDAELSRYLVTNASAATEPEAVPDAATASATDSPDILFDESLSANACDIARLYDGSVTLTDEPRAVMVETWDIAHRQLTEAMTAAAAAVPPTAGAATVEEPTEETEVAVVVTPLPIELTIETPARAAWRTLLASGEVAPTRYSLNEDDDDNEQAAAAASDSRKTATQAAESVTALLLITRSGCSLSLYDSRRGGIVFEVEEPFVTTSTADGAPPAAAEFGSESFSEPNPEDDFFRSFELTSEAETSLLAADVEYALKRLSLRLSPPGLARLGVKKLDRILWAAGDEEIEHEVSRGFAAGNLTRVFCVRPVAAAPFTELIARGLALAAYSTATDVLPAIDLARGIGGRAEEAHAAHALAAHRAAQRHGRRVALSLIAPLVVIGGVVVGTYWHAGATTTQLEAQLATEEREAARLQPITAQRKSAIENFKWYENYVRTIINLRSRQGVAIRLVDDLDARYPLDATWYVREVATEPNGDLTIKGFTKVEESVIAFARSLEFAEGLFTRVALQKNQGASTPGPGSVGGGLPAAANAGAGNALAPGVIEWTITANYTPLAEAAASTTATTTTATTTTATTTTAAATTAPNR